MIRYFVQHAVLHVAVLFLYVTFPAQADEIQDINILFKQGQQEQALVRVNAYLASKPQDVQARFLKGLVLAEQGKGNDAIRVFTELTEDYPELPEPYNNLAVLYAGQGQYDKARTALEMAIQTHPSIATAHENLGDLYAKMASQAYDRALLLDRNNTATQTKLALIKDLFSSTVKSGKKTTSPSAVTKINTLPQLHEGITGSAAATSAEASLPSASSSAHSLAPASTIAASATQENIAVAMLKAEQPASKQAGAKMSTENKKKEVLKRINGWAAAWSSQDARRYLAFYAKDFKTQGGESRDEWEAQRIARVSRPNSIKVTIKDAHVKLIDVNHAKATFRQVYRASHLYNASDKTLMMVKSGDEWLIQEEIVEK